MENETDRVIEETGVGDPLADREPIEEVEQKDPPARVGEDATREDSGDPGERDNAPDPEHTVEKEGGEGA